MKWKEMSAFFRVLDILTLACAATLIIFAIFVFTDNQSELFINISWVLLAVAALCQGIINWQKQRKAAILHLVCAALFSAAALFGFLSM